jgi:hypothetical protein
MGTGRPGRGGEARGDQKSGGIKLKTGELDRPSQGSGVSRRVMTFSGKASGDTTFSRMRA